MSAGEHSFSAVAFEQNFSLKELAAALPGGRLEPHFLERALPEKGTAFYYPFGAIVLVDAPPAIREEELRRLLAARPGLTKQFVRENFTVREEEGDRTRIVDGCLIVDRLSGGRASLIALTVAQSAAMEYYEQIVERLFERTGQIVDRLESRGGVPLGTRSLSQFIGQAIGTRNEVLSVLHLLDKPDSTWEDAAMDRIYGDLRSEFDLADRYSALESKLRAIQEALQLVLEVARDRRLFLLEASVVLLILFELVLSLWRR
ncbi:MAG TPA: RMD1 family protein [Thermoanaerobaculia bacterium]|nr:RMD1 family protein [Thermoanaerobaculia bacterium]